MPSGTGISFLGRIIATLALAAEILLASPQDEKTITRWISQLGEGIPGDSNDATRALAEIGAPAIPHLLKVFDADPPARTAGITRAQWARLRASHCLGRLNYSGTRRVLLREIRRDPEPRVRLVYTIYLIQQDTDKAVPGAQGQTRRQSVWRSCTLRPGR